LFCKTKLSLFKTQNGSFHDGDEMYDVESYQPRLEKKSTTSTEGVVLIRRKRLAKLKTTSSG